MAGNPAARGMPGGMGEGAATGLEALRSPAAITRTFSSLRETNYRNLWIGASLQMMAINMQIMARGFWVFEETGSPTRFGLVSAGVAFPMLAFSLFGGVMADRFDKKRIIQVAQVVSVVLAIIIALAIASGTMTWQYFFIASLVSGTIMAVMMPARQAIIPQLVRKEQLMNAVALQSMGMSLTTLAAPAGAGVLIAAMGVDGVYWVMAGMYVGAIFFTSLLPNLGKMSRRGNATLRSDFVDGIRYIRASKVILPMLLLGFATMIFAQPIRFVLPILALDDFDVGAGKLGLMMSMLGVGSLVGALFMASLQKMAHRGFLLLATGVVSGGILLGFSAMAHIAPILWVGMVFLALIGTIQAGRMTLGNTLLMEYTEDEYRGRVMSVRMLAFGLTPIAILPMTGIAEFMGAPIALGILAAIFVVIALTILAAAPHLRRLE